MKERLYMRVLLVGLVLVALSLSFTPVFAQTESKSLQSPEVGGEGESFLEKEAGMCAYVKANTTLDINRTKKYFRTVEKEGPDFVVGSVPVPGYDTPEDAHMFVHKDGWIIAYYSKEEPVAKIIDWKSYQPGKVVTKLYQALANVAGGLGVSLTNVKYYHYAYPEANKLMIIVDRDSFKITIPGEIPIYDVTFSSGNRDGGYRIAKVGVDKLTLDVTHIVSNGAIDNVGIGAGGTEFFALFIVYQEK